MSGERPKRTRKSHPKTRTGCLTCKIRRKKCGEEKPACLRCTSTGRKCDGYPVVKKSNALPTPPASPDDAVDHWAGLEQTEDGNATKILVEKRRDLEVLRYEVSDCAFSEEFPPDLFEFDIPTPDSLIAIDRYHNHPASTPCSLSELEYYTPLTLQPTISCFASEKEFYCFDFFCRQTNPLFTHYFETTMWAGPMMQASFHPAVQQAMIALGAAHRRYEMGITPEAFEYCAFSMQAYSKAMAATREFLAATGGSPSAEMTVILSWLFGAYEVFQGNEESASKHLTAGLQAFFAQKFQKQESRTVKRSVHLNEKNLRILFRKLDEKSVEIFGEPARILSKPGDPSGPPECPNHFYNMEHARDVLFTQIHWNFHAIGHEEADDASRLATQTECVGRLLEWSAAYASLCKTMTKTRSSCQNHRATATCVLRLCRELAYLVILLQPLARRECNGEKFCRLKIEFLNESKRRVLLNDNFAKLLVLADQLLESDSQIFEKSLKRPSFIVDSGIHPPLYLASRRCRSATIRHQATSLLLDSPREARIRNSLGAWNIVERTSMIEEEAVLKCNALPAEVRDDAKWVRLTAFLEERKVLRSYCIPEKDKGVDGLVWVQEWITF